MEVKKTEIKFENSQLVVDVDTNQDGVKALTAKVHLTEAIQEAFSKGTKIEGAKVVDFKFSGTMLVLSLDTDQDNEHVLDIEINLVEGLKEAGVLK